MKNKVSIIVPIYNAEDTLDRCIKSLINQTYKNIEIILIDDGSVDNSYKICEKYKKNDKRIIVFSKKNTGVSDTRNYGYKNSSGDYIMFADADDYMDINMVDKMLFVLEREKASLVCCIYFDDDKETKKKLANNIENFTKQEYYKSLFSRKEVQGFITNKIYKKEILQKIEDESQNIFDKDIDLCEDLLLNVKIGKYCKKVCLINERLYNYQINPNGIMHNNSINKKRITVLSAFDKIIDIYKSESQECLDLVYYNYLKNYIELQYRNNIYNANFDINFNEQVKVKDIIFGKNIKIGNKIYIYLLFKFPYVFSKMKHFIKKIVISIRSRKK